MPSPMLVMARQELEAARADPNAELAGGSIARARRALAEAEAVHSKRPWSEADRSYTYVAQRRAELSVVLGSNARAQQTQQQTRGRRDESAADVSDRRLRAEMLTTGEAPASLRAGDNEVP